MKVLMITYNRLDYTKQALPALINSGVDVIVIDNNSTDGTVEWLREFEMYNHHALADLIFNDTNIGIAGAMNQFLRLTDGEDYVGKVDNDTIVELGWDAILKDKCRLHNIDMIQAKHPIIPATHPEGWKGFTKHMRRKAWILYHHFIGGSGIVFRRDKVNHIPETDNLIGGWREFQRQRPELTKAFCEAVEIKLLDTSGAGTDYSKYPEYYKQTGRC